MKNKLTAIFLTAVLLVSSALNALAGINSVSEINGKISRLNQISSQNFLSFINKTDLIGNRLQNFEMLTSQYKNEVTLAQENLRSIIKQVDVIESSPDLVDSEKTIQIDRLYQEADTILYNIDSKTMQYIYSLSRIMPTLTYQKYSKKFKDFYNDLNLTNSKIKA